MRAPMLPSLTPATKNEKPALTSLSIIAWSSCRVVASTTAASEPGSNFGGTCSSNGASSDAGSATRDWVCAITVVLVDMVGGIDMTERQVLAQGGREGFMSSYWFLATLRKDESRGHGQLAGL